MLHTAFFGMLFGRGLSSSTDLYGSQVFGQRADHQLAGLIIVEKVDAKQIFWVVAYLEMPVQGYSRAFSVL